MLPSVIRDLWEASPWLLAGAALLLGLAGGWLWQLWRLRGQRQLLRADYLSQPGPPETTMRAVSDTARGQDTLGYEAVARALAGLLGNPATSAPYTVVVSGNWGSGKSSVMLQTQAQLPAQFVSIPLNVWHYQSGQHLLGAFLRRLYDACNTRPYRRRFRWLRLGKLGFLDSLRLGVFVALLLPVGLYLLWLLLEPALEAAHLAGWLVAGARRLYHWHLGPLAMGHLLLAPFRLLRLAPELLKTTPPDPGAAPASATPELLLGGTALAWLVSLVGLLRSAYSAGDVVSELVPMQQFEQKITADAGFRDEFRQQLLDVLQYAPPATRLVFFVDDIDRIPGSRVLELLESLSFLLDTCREALAATPDPEQGARLYFVLGMYVPAVVSTLASVLPAPPEPQADARRHAAHYLDKLIDLVVPMPTLAQCSPEQIASLLFGPVAAASLPRSA